MLDIPERLDTPSLILRKPVLEDAETILATYGSDPEVARYVLFRSDQTVDQVREFLRETLQGWEQQTRCAWVLTLRGRGELVGMIDLRLEPEANLGYALARKAWGRGLATEAVGRVVAWVLGVPEIHRVWAAVEVNNIPSVRVLEKVGFVREQVMRGWMVFPNLGDSPRDCYKYVLDRPTPPRPSGP